MNGAPTLTLRERQLYEHLRARHARGEPAPSLHELRGVPGLAAGSLAGRQVSALVTAGLIEPLTGREEPIRLRTPTEPVPTQLPLLG